MDLNLLKQMFLDDLKEKITALELIILEKNYEEIKQIAHKIKGNSAGLVLNYQEINEIGRNLEHAAINQEYDLILVNLKKLRSILAVIS